MADYALSPRFQAAISALFNAHREDPTKVPTPTTDNPEETTPYSEIYHTRLAHYVSLLSHPSVPSEPLLLAAHGQHIYRWKVPRSSYPEGLAGYKRWRAGLAKMHADETERILTECGYAADPATTDVIPRVRDLIMKRNLATDEEVQMFEDAICLVFLEKEFEGFAGKLSEEKIVDVVKKTWKKMGEKGHKAALSLLGSLPVEAREIIEKALAPTPPDGDVEAGSGSGGASAASS
ncbi:hypothetical protein HK104_001506 [Borealophlyctis nickersoniae]|nr:hypothetical protein HK104_001506 [Borealophlyctis nickersoniae]